MICGSCCSVWAISDQVGRFGNAFIAWGLPAGREKARNLSEPFPLYSHWLGARVARLRSPILRTSNEIVADACSCGNRESTDRTNIALPAGSLQRGKRRDELPTGSGIGCRTASNVSGTHP